MLARCSCCGVQTETPDLFLKERRSFRSTTGTYCPRCWQERQVSLARKLFLWQLAPGPVGFLCIAALPQSSIGWLLLNIFLFQLFCIVAVLPHEFAHAWAGRVLGLRVFRVIIGAGRTVFTRTILGFETEFKATPAGGLTIASHLKEGYFRVRQFGFVLAGPLINLLLALAVHPVAADHLWSLEPLERQLAPGPLFFYANLLVLLANLWPRDVDTIFGKFPSDGKSLFLTFTINEERIQESLAATYAMEAAAAHEQGDYTKAEAAIEAGLRRFPKNLNLLSWKIMVLIPLHQFHEARRIAFEILPRCDDTPLHHTMMLNNIAYLDALLDEPELLAEADEFSSRAMSHLSWHPAVTGTRGSVLVQLGQIDEGIALLKKSMAAHEGAAGMAENACFLTLAEAKRANTALAREYLEEARLADPKCYLLERVENFINAQECGGSKEGSVQIWNVDEHPKD